jgi:hypothetical protein
MDDVGVPTRFSSVKLEHGTRLAHLPAEITQVDLAPIRAFGVECCARLDLCQRPPLLASEPTDVDASRVEQPIATKGSSTRDIR